MMYHCIAIAVGFPSDTKDFENVSHPSLYQPVDDRQKHAEEKHRRNHHRRGRDHVILARPGYLLHFHAHVVQKFARVRNRSGNSLADARGRSGDGVAARLVVLHFYRLRGHENLFTSRNRHPSRSVFLDSRARSSNVFPTTPSPGAKLWQGRRDSNPHTRFWRPESEPWDDSPESPIFGDSPGG